MRTKKLLSLLLAISMLFGSLSAVTFAADEETEKATEDIKNEPYYRAVTLLGALEIMKGKSETEFGAEDILTRAEMCALAVRFLGMETDGADGESAFSDVDNDYWGKNCINTAAALGLVNGTDGGRFEPEGEVTAEQALKIMVCALGYEPKAQDKGGYPQGYLAAAAELGLTDGAALSGKYGMALPRWKAAMIIYNALEAPLMEGTYGTNSSFSVSENGTALSKYHDTEKKTGVLTATYTTAIDNDELQVGDVVIDGVTYTTKLDMSEYVGYSIDFYHKTDRDASKDEIIAFFPRESNTKVTEIDIDDIVSVKVADNFDVKVEYLTNDGKSLKNVSIKSPIIMYNGKAEKFDTSDKAQEFLDNNIKQGKLKLMNGTAGKTDNIIYVENYDAYVVSSVNGEKMSVTYNEYTVGRTDTKTLDLSDDEKPNRKVFVYGEDGSEISLTDIVKNDVIMVYASADKSLYRIYVSKKQVSGVIEKMSKVSGDEPEWTPTEPEPEPQPYWENISTVSMDGFTLINKNGNPNPWTYEYDKVNDDGRTVNLVGSSEGGLNGPNTGIVNVSDLSTSWYGAGIAQLPEITSQQVFRINRSYLTTGAQWWWNHGWPGAASSLRPLDIFDSEKVAEGDRIRITAWVYPAGLLQRPSAGSGDRNVVQDTGGIPVAIRMWLAGNGTYNSGNPTQNYKKPEECLQTTVPTKQWTPISIEYTIDGTNKSITSLRIDNHNDDVTAPYPENMFVAGVKVERYVDPNIGKEEEPTPRPEVTTDPRVYDIYIDKVKYKPANGFPTSLLEVGKKATLYLDANGKIVGFGTSFADMDFSGYGMLLDACVSDDPFDKSSIKLKILNADNTVRVYKTLDKITAWNGTDVTKVTASSLITNEPIDNMTTHYLWSTNNAENFQCIPRSWLSEDTKSKAASRKLIYYKANSKGEINTVLVPSIPENHPQCKISMIKDFEYDPENPDNSLVYYSFWPRFLTHSFKKGRLDTMYRMANICPKFCVWSGNYDESDYSVNNEAWWKDNVIDNMNLLWYRAQLYRYPGSKTVDFIVANPHAAAGRYAKNILVKDVLKTETGYSLEGYLLNYTGKATTDYSKPLKENLRLFENIWMTSPNANAKPITIDNIYDCIGTLPFNVSYESDAMGNQETPYVDDTNLYPGDVVRVLEDGNGEIFYLEVVRRVKTGIAACYTMANAEYIDGIFDKDNGFVNGEIVEVNSKVGYVKIKTWLWPGTDEVVSSSEKGYTQAENVSRNYITEITLDWTLLYYTFYWDEERERFQTATEDDYRVGDKILIISSFDNPKGVILFKNHKAE